MSGIVGQNTLDNSGLVKAPAGGGAWNFISKQTASSSADISFTSGIDSTYKEYVFTFNNIHPSDDEVDCLFNLSIDAGSNYNVTKTTTFCRPYHLEQTHEDAAGGPQYQPNDDLAQGTGFQSLADRVDNDNDSCWVGTLHLYNPSSSVFVKHFIANTNTYRGENSSEQGFCAGYVNTTTALTRVQFKMYSGNTDAGDICLYGITT